MSDFLKQFLEESYHFSLLEIIAVLTAVIYVYLMSRTNRWGFLFGGISSIIYVYLFIVYKLYFDSLINAYYVVMSVYGWILWNKPTEELKIKKLPLSKWGIYLFFGFTATFIMGYLAATYTDASIPYWDAFTTSFSVIATYLVVKKFIANWILFIVVDIVATGMYFYKDLYLTAILFILYTSIAIIGFFKWRKMLPTNA